MVPRAERSYPVPRDRNVGTAGGTRFTGTVKSLSGFSCLEGTRTKSTVPQGAYYCIAWRSSPRKCCFQCVTLGMFSVENLSVKSVHRYVCSIDSVRPILYLHTERTRRITRQNRPAIAIRIVSNGSCLTGFRSRRSWWHFLRFSSATSLVAFSGCLFISSICIFYSSIPFASSLRFMRRLVRPPKSWRSDL